MAPRVLADLLSIARAAMPGAVDAPEGADPLAVAAAMDDRPYNAAPPPTARETASLARNASTHLRGILPSYSRDQAPTPFLLAADDVRCPPKVREKLRVRSDAINAATERNRLFVFELIDMLEGREFAQPVPVSPSFFPMSNYVPTTASASCQPSSYDSIETLMGHLSRDWSTEHDFTGAKSYEIMLRMLEKYVPKGGKVLLPGAGLGRLGFEIAKRGFRVEMNDCSPVMAAIAHLMLSHVRHPRHCHPFLHRWKNLIHGDERDQMTVFEVPMVPPGTEAAELRAKGADILPIDITLGEFGKLYSAPPNDSRLRAAGSGFDAVISSFFIDKANSDTWGALLEIVLPIKPGGILINAGPLAWKGDAKPMLTLDEVLLFWETHPKTRLELLDQESLPVDYSRREGALLYTERYISPIMALRKTAGMEEKEVRL
ncbi:N2227-like protein-domain-containing protein [Hyaloraphidium curvatum]|nr:N2227-like protein-domain-containing protein [Hyaloraphidium curvatum]